MVFFFNYRPILCRIFSVSFALEIVMLASVQGRVKLLSSAGSAAVLFNGINESWRLARKILFLVLTVIREILTLLAILHLELAKNLFAASSAEQLNSPQMSTAHNE